MDVVTDIISGNPLSTPIGALIERATAAGAGDDDWALIMHVCDEVNLQQQQSDGQSARDAWRAIRRRLHQTAGKDHTAFDRTLTVLEACMKNCGRRFHLLVCQKEFIQDLVKMIGPKYDPPVLVQERVLGMIRAWAEAFSRQSDMSGVRFVYEEMTARSVAFPAPSGGQPLQQLYSEHPVQQRVSAANNLPPAGRPVDPATRARAPAAPAVDSERLARELHVVAENSLVLSEMLTALKPTQVSEQDLELLQRLVATCREMHSRLVQAIDCVSGDSLVAEMLRLSDELNNCFIRYERFERLAGRDESKQQQQAKAEPQVSLLDTTNDSALSRKTEQLTLQPTPAAASSVLPSVGEKPSISEIGAGATSLPLTDDARPSDFDEMEKWLKDDVGSNQSGTMTSSEFDSFLAERAGANRPHQ